MDGRMDFTITFPKWHIYILCATIAWVWNEQIQNNDTCSLSSMETLTLFNISTRWKVSIPVFRSQRLVGFWRSILVKHLITDPGKAVAWIIHLFLLGRVCWQDTLTLWKGNRCGYDGHQTAARLLLTRAWMWVLICQRVYVLCVVTGCGAM